MANKILKLIVETLFPPTYLERYLRECSELTFERRLTPRPQMQRQMFSPYYYKDPMVRDCIIELKERNNQNAARLLSRHLAGYACRMIGEITNTDSEAQFFLVPVPQHKSKTREKRFSHTDTLCAYVYKRVSETGLQISLFPCVEKVHKTKRLHDLKGRALRFKTIKHTMAARMSDEQAKRGYFFIVDDVHTTGATFKEMRRSLSDCGASHEQMFFLSIAH